VDNILSAKEKVDLQMMQRIQQEEMKHSQVAFLAHQLTDFCGPRLPTHLENEGPLHGLCKRFSIGGLPQRGKSGVSVEKAGVMSMPI
jgi:hypothetical protein